MLDREWESRFVYLDIIIYIKRETERHKPYGSGRWESLKGALGVVF